MVSRANLLGAYYLISKSLRHRSSDALMRTGQNSLWSWIGLRAFSVIVLWKRGGQGWLSGTDRLVRVWPGQPKIAGWAFDAMTGKKGINEFDQTFHRGSS